jgi:PAS domain S-box
MFLRVVIVTFLLGIAAFIQVKGTETLSGISFRSVYFIILLTYILSFLYLFLLKIIKSLGWNIYIQSLSDVTLITALVYVTGGVESTYSVFYILVIIYSALFLGGRGSIIIASASGVLYGLLIEFEYCGLIQPVYFASRDYGYSAGYVLSRGFIHIVSFYIVAFLAGFAAGQEKKTRDLLAEKESAFDQLDLLHRSIIESVDTGILTVDLQGYIKSFNRAAEEITGFSHSEVINGKIGDFFQGFYDMLSRVKDGNGCEDNRSRLEVTVSDKTLGYSVSPLMDGGEKKIGNILIFQDLTDIKEMERQSEKTRDLPLLVRWRRDLPMR